MNRVVARTPVWPHGVRRKRTTTISPRRVIMLLKVGSSGDDVKKLQQKLGLDADGIFGPGTERAVKDWQDANGLDADGIVGPGTWGAMFPAAPASAATAPPAPVAPAASAGDLKLDALSGHVPDAVIRQIPDCATKFDINTPLRLAHFLAQCGHESNGFITTQENLNYSADGLKKIFPKYFPDDLADSYARQPEKIASRVYANRMGNGDEASGDGYTYRGRGYIQLTGKDNYRAFGEATGVDSLNNPDSVADPYALLSAGWFWNSRALNALADAGASDEAVTEITERVNGGTLGLDDRISRFKEIYAVLA
jgi:putative chitinase